MLLLLVFTSLHQLVFSQSETQNTALPYWRTRGNSGTNSGSNFIGTSDFVSWRVRTNNIERMVVDSLGYIGIGTTQPQYKIDVVAPGNTIGMRLLSGNTAQVTYISLGRTFEYAQIGACTAGTFFTDALAGDMAVKNFNSGKLLLGANFFGTSAMSIGTTGNIGVNTYTGNTRVDINGDLALREGTALVMANGANNNLTLGAFSHYRIIGPTAAFSITGLAGGQNGKVVTLINTTAFPMTLSHDITSTAANRIYTPNSTTLEVPAIYGSVSLMYNSTLSRWLVTSVAGESDAGDWHTTGNSGINSGANFIGTTNLASFRMRTNNVERMVIDSLGRVGIGQPFPGDALTLSDAALPVFSLGNPAFNSAESGRISFHENIDTYSGSVNLCGFQIHHDGIANKLFLYGGCTAIDTVMTFTRVGTVGVQTTNPSETFELGGFDATLYMNSNTSNNILFNTQGVAAPAFTTRSLGTKLIFYPQVTATTVDYAMGIASGTLWSSVPEATAIHGHRWYGGITELMRLRGDGRLGIGTTTPTATRLHCFDPSLATARVAIFQNGTNAGTEVQIGSIEYMRDYASTTDFNNGFNSIGFSINLGATAAYDLQLLNNSAAKPTNGSWTIASDERLKEDITPFKEGLEVLEQINPTYWKYNGQAKTPKGEYGIGVTAQAMQKVAPYMVGTFEYLSPDVPFEQSKANIQTYLSYNPDALHYVTVNAVKELHQKEKKIEQVLTNVTEFGTGTVSGTLTVNYPNSFTQNIDGIPVVTVTPVGSNAQLSITSQTATSFTVQVTGNNNAPVNFNWIAAAKTKANLFEIDKNYTIAERQAMLDKVKLAKGYIRLEEEEKEMQRRKAAGE